MQNVLGAAIALIASLVGILAVVYLQSGASADNKAARAQHEAIALAAGIKQIYAGSNAFSNSLPSPGGGTGGNCLLVNAGLAPGEMLAGGCNLVSPWAGAVTVYGRWNGVPSTVDVRFSSVPLAVCVNLVRTAAYATCAGAVCAQGGMTAAQAQANCTAGGTVDLVYD